MADPFHPSTRRAVSLSFRDYGSDSFVEVTAWTNAEGYDVEIHGGSDLGERRFPLTEYEADALIACISAVRVREAQK